MTTKNILITGGTGFLGSALIADWLAQGHQITLISRDPLAAMQQLGNQINAVSDFHLLPHSAQFDVIVNLAGAPLFSSRWSEARKQQIRDSRIGLTQQLVAFIASLQHKPEVLISGSAIGIYGDQGDTVLTEQSSGKADFGQQLCSDWEQAALQAESLGVRVCLIRTGLVLGNHGGLLQRMLPAFKFGLGGCLGNGQQWMSWIHFSDWLAIVNSLIEHPELSGAFNATAPNPVSNQSFSQQLAKQLHRPALLPMPSFVLKLLLGEMSELILGSQRVLPEHLLAAGFKFQYPELAPALQQILNSD
jgi:uncharacterized protein (TIGR01777 family)